MQKAETPTITGTFCLFVSQGIQEIKNGAGTWNQALNCGTQVSQATSYPLQKKVHSREARFLCPFLIEWGVRLFSFLAFMNDTTTNTGLKIFLQQADSTSLGCTLSSEIIGSYGSFIFQNCYSQGWYSFTLPQQCVSSPFPASGQFLPSFIFLVITILGGVRCHVTVISQHVSVMVRNPELFFSMYLLVICVSSLRNIC